MAKNNDSNGRTVKPFVKPGEDLGYVGPLKERGMWPPRLHNDKDNGHRDGKVTTPYLLIPLSNGDTGQRPQPNSLMFHSKGIWLEDTAGNATDSPVIGASYKVKCRIRNLGAAASYGGLADFFVNTPEAIEHAAATNTPLTALGHTGFSVMQGQDVVLTCPKPWQPSTADELLHSIIVHAYDPFADTIMHRFDAAHDRHVGRHDLITDFYVRDWTNSATVFDQGLEPSANAVFYATSDVWNRRSNTPGSFINGQPQNENPQAGDGSKGDNFMFARISRNSGTGEQTVSAHFMFAEFGTGSPFTDCSLEPDPSVTFLPGETQKIISLPWHLHPSASTHLCIAVQIYSASDPYVAPGLSGYTPGWPTTDLMVINDNNKAQRNISVWDGVPESEGLQYATVFNAATFTRDVTLTLNASRGVLAQVKNAVIGLPGSGQTQPFKVGSKVVLKAMMPGETRWIALAYDSFTVTRNQVLSFYFNEVENGHVLNGFAFNLKANSIEGATTSVIDRQSAIFYRMAIGMEVRSANEGLMLCQRLLQAKIDSKTYLRILNDLLNILSRSLTEMSAAYGGLKDVFGINESLKRLLATINELPAATVLAQHGKIINQIDALQTTAVQSKGSEANILFTVRLQKELYASAKINATGKFNDLINLSDVFVKRAVNATMAVTLYPSFMQSALKYIEATLEVFDNAALAGSYREMLNALNLTPAELQITHLMFLRNLELSVSRSIPLRTVVTKQPA